MINNEGAVINIFELTGEDFNNPSNTSVEDIEKELDIVENRQLLIKKLKAIYCKRIYWIVFYK